ncbi:hypothetical protein PENTCL1PPCAC_17438, partial [Pristionchus entomophagus]
QMASRSIRSSMAQPSFDPLTMKREMEVTRAREARGGSGRRKMKIKIYERSVDNGDKEVRVELSCPSDDDMVFAGGVTKANYSQLKKKFKNLNVNFEEYADKLIRQLSPSDPKAIVIYVVESDDQRTCTLQTWRDSDIQLNDLPIDMRAVVGEDLHTYLKTSLRSERNKARELEDGKKRAEDRVIQLEKEYEIKMKLEKENELLNEELREARAAEEDNKMDLNEWKQKYETAEGMMEDMREEMKELHDEITQAMDGEDAAKEEIEGLIAEIDELKSQLDHKDQKLIDTEKKLSKAYTEIDSLEENITSLERKCRKARDNACGEKMLHLVKKDEPPVVSCDERKLKELEGDVTEKNEMIEKMRERMSEMVKEKEQFELIRVQLEQSNRQMQMDLEKTQKLLDVYRRPSLSTPHGVSSMTSPHYSPSVQAYSTPPTVPNTTTPSAVKHSLLSRSDLQQYNRVPFTLLNRPHTPVLARNLDGQSGPGTTNSPRVLSYNQLPRNFANTEKKD